MEELSRKIDSIVGVTRSEKDYFLSNVTVKELQKDDMLIKAGQIAAFVCYVETGVLRSFLTKDEREINTEFFFKDSFASAFTSFAMRTPTALNIQAIENSTVIVISKNLVEELYLRDPKWYALGKYFFQEEFIKKCKRESSFLLHNARERYLALLEQYPTIEESVSKFHISSYLGIQPETLSRIRSGKF